MIAFTFPVEVCGKSPKEIYNWMLNLDNEKFKIWHPSHIEYRTIKRTPNGIGGIVYSKEKIGGLEVKFTAEIQSARPDEFLLYRGRFFVISEHISLTLEPISDGTKVVFDIGVEFRGIFGRILGFLVKKFYPVSLFGEALQNHIKEEFKNLEKLL